MSAVQRSPRGTPASSAAPPGNPQRERPVHAFPAQRLEEVLRECRAPARPLVADPPPSIERLSADELSLLEGTLRPRLMHDPHAAGPANLSPETRNAAHAWVQVQSARLRRPGNAHDASLRTEHVDALNDFLQILHPSTPLPLVLRRHLVIAFNRHRTEEWMPPPVHDLVEAQGIETLAAGGYWLDGRNGAFQPVAGISPWPALQEPQPPLAPAGLLDELALNHVLELSSAPRSRIGKLPDSEQYRHIKSMTPAERTFLESSLETRFMNHKGQVSPEDALRAVDAWLTTQQVRLRIHSEASIQHHAQALRSPVIGLRMAAAGLGAARWPSEFSRFHSEHESSKRPEYASALNNFLRLLQPSSLLSADLRQRIADRLTHHAEVEATLSAPVVEAMRQQGPHVLAAANWRLDAANNVFSPHPVVVIAPEKSVYWWAIPTPHTPASPLSTGQPGPDLSRNTPASAPAPP
jgi:hypothetical protein